MRRQYHPDRCANRLICQTGGKPEGEKDGEMHRGLSALFLLFERVRGRVSVVKNEAKYMQRPVL